MFFSNRKIVEHNYLVLFCFWTGACVWERFQWQRSRATSEASPCSINPTVLLPRRKPPAILASLFHLHIFTNKKRQGVNQRQNKERPLAYHLKCATVQRSIRTWESILRVQTRKKKTQLTFTLRGLGNTLSFQGVKQLDFPNESVNKWWMAIIWAVSGAQRMAERPHSHVWTHREYQRHRKWRPGITDRFNRNQGENVSLFKQQDGNDEDILFLCSKCCNVLLHIEIYRIMHYNKKLYLCDSSSNIYWNQVNYMIFWSMHLNTLLYTHTDIFK